MSFRIAGGVWSYFQQYILFKEAFHEIEIAIFNQISFDVVLWLVKPFKLRNLLQKVWAFHPDLWTSKVGNIYFIPWCEMALNLMRFFNSLSDLVWVFFKVAPITSKRFWWEPLIMSFPPCAQFRPLVCWKERSEKLIHWKVENMIALLPDILILK